MSKTAMPMGRRSRMGRLGHSGLAIIALSLPWIAFEARIEETRETRAQLAEPVDLSDISGTGELLAVADSYDPRLAREMMRDYARPEAQIARERESREAAHQLQARRRAAFYERLIFDSACRLGLAWGIGLLLIVVDFSRRATSASL